MILEEYILDNTKVKFYDDAIARNVIAQKEYIDSIIISFLYKTNNSLSL